MVGIPRASWISTTHATSTLRTTDASSDAATRPIDAARHSIPVSRALLALDGGARAYEAQIVRTCRAIPNVRLIACGNQHQ